MSELIKFSIDKLELIEYTNKSQFAKARIDFFASGNNAHGMPVKEENLIKYADTILGKPLVYVIEKGWLKKEDFGTHDPLEVPMGFFRENEKIEFKRLTDGRLMASAVALIWKKYADKAMKIFSRDGALKPVSVEMQLITSKETEDGEKEIVDFAFTGCTILGTDVRPAIKDAQIEILAFSQAKQEYEDKMKKYIDIDFTIPEIIKGNINSVLKFAKKNDSLIVPEAFIKAEYIINNNTISPDDVQDFVLFFNRHKDDSSFFLCGGEESKKWLEEVSEKIKQADEINFSETDIKEEERMVDIGEEKVDELDQKEQESQEFATDANVEGAAALVRSEEETEGDKETVEEAKEEKDFVEEEKEEGEESEKEDEEEAESEEMSALKEEFSKLKEKCFALENEIKELREFKAGVEESDKNAKIEFALSEVSDVMPKEKVEEWREKASTIEFSAIDVWANAVKADAFTYVKQTVVKDKEPITRMALPNNEKKQTVKKSIWAD